MANKRDVERHALALQQMVTKQQMERLIEFSKLRKEVVLMALGSSSEEDVNLLWLRLEELESTILRDDYGMYLRGASDGKYKEEIKNRYQNKN
jgi:IS1 family transposase